jgi:hypothetical protein
MQTDGVDKRLAAVCGLYCGACNAYIATTEDPARLKDLAVQFGLTEEAIRCKGCRSSKKGPYCAICKMSACAAERRVDFCVECAEYPCDDLEQFQAEAPHRLDLWESLERIEEAGWVEWLARVREDYTCPACGTVNSAYDLMCRTCGGTPSCDFVYRHEQDIVRFLRSWDQEAKAE